MKAILLPFIILFLLTNTAICQNLIINDFGGEIKSFNIEILQKDGKTVFKPIRAKNGLDISDINVALRKGDVVLQANHGDILTTSGLFKPEISGRKLLLDAKGKVDFSIAHDSPLKIDIQIKAGSIVTIVGPGVKTNGGKFESSGTKLIIDNSGLSTQGGDVVLVHSGSIEIKGSGLKTNGGNIEISGSNLDIKNEGLHSNGGDITFCQTGDLNITGSGIKSLNGNLTIEGKKLTVTSDGIDTGIGTCLLNMSGDIDIRGKGISSGHMATTGVNIRIQEKGISTKRGLVLLEHTGNIGVFGEGINTNGGPITCVGYMMIVGGDVTLGGSGIQTKNGKIHIKLKDQIIVQANGICSGTAPINIYTGGNVEVSRGGVSTDNADILVQTSGGKISLDGFNVNTFIGEKKGEGILDTSQILPGTLILHTEPVLGGGNITLITSR